MIMRMMAVRTPAGYCTRAAAVENPTEKPLWQAAKPSPSAIKHITMQGPLDDTQKARYDAGAAKTAWDRTTEFFKANLS